MGAADARLRPGGRLTAPAAGGADPGALRDAATVILWRDRPDGPEVLMGQRGATAAFMPNKVVFPGGAVDDADADVPLEDGPDPACLARLAQHADPALGRALLAAAVREVWEETGLVLGRPAP